MLLTRFVRNFTNQRNVLYVAQRAQSNAIDIEKLEKESIELEVIDDDAKLREDEIQRKRNKSRLYTPHRNIVLGKPPYTEPKIAIHETVKYQRKLYGKYGSASGVDPKICFPTKQELINKAEYEAVAYPFTIKEMAENSKKLKTEKVERIKKRQLDIVAKVAKLETWTKELADRISKKEAEIQAAKDKKDKLIEEVRRHFGYTVDPRDEKFKEMLERKEKEQKKLAKEARKKAKEEKLMNKLLQKDMAVTEDAEPK